MLTARAPHSFTGNAPPEEGQAEPRVGAEALYPHLLPLEEARLTMGLPSRHGGHSLFGDSGIILDSLGSQ